MVEGLNHLLCPSPFPRGGLSVSWKGFEASKWKAERSCWYEFQELQLYQIPLIEDLLCIKNNDKFFMDIYSSIHFHLLNIGYSPCKELIAFYELAHLVFTEEFYIIFLLEIRKLRQQQVIEFTKVTGE